MSASTVYFIQAGDAGPIKIGVTRGCPLDRMANLQTGCPEALKLVAHASGTADDERELHKRFAHLRLRGEWFLAKPELVEFIRGIRFATRSQPPLERAHEPMIGGLCREDLERIAAYVSTRMLEKRAESLLMVAQMPFRITEFIRNELSDVFNQLSEVELDSEIVQLADPDNRLIELRDAAWEEFCKSDADKDAEYALLQEQVCHEKANKVH